MLLWNIMKAHSPPPQVARSGKQSGPAGFALVESVIGMALISLMLACVFAASAHLRGVVRMAKESTFATEMIQERIERMRTSDFEAFTDPTKLQALATTPTTTANNLPGAVETISVVPLNNPTNLSIVCTRNQAGTASATGDDLTAQRSVKVSISVKWRSRARERERVVMTILTRGGI
jgi:type II secretory pathway pseudopilin PulG